MPNFYKHTKIYLFLRNRFKTYAVCMEYCDEVMKKEMSSASNGNTAMTNALPPDRDRFVISVKSYPENTKFTC